MKKTLQDQYLLIKEGKGHKDIFIKEAKRQFPGLIRNAATYTEVANVLKSKNHINENVIGLEPINQLEPSKKESYEIAFENFLAEAKKAKEDDEKAELKKPSKQVEEDAEKNFDYEDKKNPDNLIFDQIMKGYYTEMKDPKNEDKTMEQLKAIVIKNLEKNPTYYTEKGQFGVKDLGYTMDAPGLGEPKEPKGKYKSSGYGNLNENKESINESTFKYDSGDYEEVETLFTKITGRPATDLDNNMFSRGGGSADGDGEGWMLNIDDTNIPASDKTKFVDAVMDLGKQRGWKIKQYGDDAVEIYEKDPLSEETQIRKVVRSIINEELEEEVNSEKDERYFIKGKKRKNTSHLPGFHKPALGEEELEEGYDDGEMGTHQRTSGTNTRHRKNPQDMETYLNAIKGMKKVEAIEYLGEEGLSSSMVMRVLNKADQMGMFDVQDMFDVNPTIRGDVFEFKKNDDVMYMGEKHKVIFSDDHIIKLERNNGNVITLNKSQADEKVRYQEEFAESLNESKIRKVIRESVEKELAEINKLAEYEVYESKLEKIAELIEKKCSRLNRLDEDEDLKALTDKKKVKELQRDIKKLEKAKAKLEKALAKKAKAAPKKKEVIDEDEPLSEAPGDSDDAKNMADDLERGAEAAAQIKDDLLDEDMEAPADYLEAKEDAEGRYDAGEELDSILSDYPKHRETLERDILGKFDGMDY